MIVEGKNSAVLKAFCSEIRVEFLCPLESSGIPLDIFYGESKINHRKEREDRKKAEERKSTETDEKEKREFGHEDKENSRRPQTTLGRTHTKNRMEDRSSRN